MIAVIIGNLDQLEWLVCTFGRVKAFLVVYVGFNNELLKRLVMVGYENLKGSNQFVCL